MLKHKTALVLVRVSDPTAVRSPGSSNNNGDLGTVVLHRKSYVVKPSGSVDSTGKKIPALDTPGVSKRGHLEINAKMQPMKVIFTGKSILQRAWLYYQGEPDTPQRILDQGLSVSLQEIKAGVVLSMCEQSGPFWRIEIQDIENAPTAASDPTVSDVSSSVKAAPENPEPMTSSSPNTSAPVSETHSAESAKQDSAALSKASSSTNAAGASNGWGFLRRGHKSSDSLARVLRNVVLPPNWTVTQGSILMRQFGSSAWPAASHAKVAAFDFDDTLIKFYFHCPPAERLHLVHQLVPARLRELHALGYKLVVFTNQDMERFKDPAKIQATVERKLGRLEAFMEISMAGEAGGGDQQTVPPILFLCATARDANRKGCTTKAGDVGGTGLWDCCEKLWSDDASKRGDGTAGGGGGGGGGAGGGGGRSSSIDKRLSFYVGNAAGRAGDHSDCDLHLARRVGIPFFTESDFFACPTIEDVEASVAKQAATISGGGGSDETTPTVGSREMTVPHPIPPATTLGGDIDLSTAEWSASCQTLGPVRGLRGSFADALYPFIEETPATAVRARMFYSDPTCVIFYDGFPKARVHLLLVPRLSFLDRKQGIADLTRADLPRLHHLHAVAKAAVRRCRPHVRGRVRCGYHTVPSLHQLHLHIVSDDFDSVCLKKKKHWNSFTTSFFVHPETVERQLKDNGFVAVDKAAAEALLKQPMVCHRCAEPQVNIPALKAHVAHCTVVTACVGDDNVSAAGGGKNAQAEDAPPRNKRGRF